MVALLFVDLSRDPAQSQKRISLKDATAPAISTRTAIKQGGLKVKQNRSRAAQPGKA